MFYRLTKGDLRSGDFVVFRNESVYQVFPNNGVLSGRSPDSGFMTLENYNENLSYRTEDYQYDIVKVIRPQHPTQFSYNDYTSGGIMFEENKSEHRCREEREMTVVEIQKELGLGKLKIIDRH